MRFPVTMRISKEWAEKHYDKHGNTLKAKNEAIDARVWYIYAVIAGNYILLPYEDAELSGLIDGPTKNDSIN